MRSWEKWGSQKVGNDEVNEEEFVFSLKKVTKQVFVNTTKSIYLNCLQMKVLQVFKNVNGYMV